MWDSDLHQTRGKAAEAEHRSILTKLRVTLLVAGLAAAVGAGVASASATTDDNAQRHDSVDVVDRIAAQTLAAEHGVDFEEALARIVEQERFASVAETLRSELGPHVWAGSWIDHAGTGELVINVTRHEDGLAARNTLTPEIRDRVRVETVGHSVRELEDLNDRLVADLRAEIGGNPDSYIDVRRNDIVLHIGQKAPTTDRAAAQSISAQYPVRIVTPAGERTNLACMTWLQICDQPTRGGVEITDAVFNANNPGLILQCTLGFVVRRTSNHSSKVGLTAGHCFAQSHPDWWITGKPKFTNYSLGSTISSMIHLPPNHDVAGFAVPNVSLNHTWVLVQPSGGTSPTTRNEWYPINNVGYGSTLPAGSYLCKTGMFSATECATVQGYSGYFVTMKNPTGEWASIACAGDSGGPVYKSNKGYGIISDGYITGTETRATYFGGTFNNQCVGAGSTWRYYSLPTALWMTGTELIP